MSNGLHSSPLNCHPCPRAQSRVEGDVEGPDLSARRSGWSLVWLREAVVG